MGRPRRDKDILMDDETDSTAAVNSDTLSAGESESDSTTVVNSDTFSDDEPDGTTDVDSDTFSNNGADDTDDEASLFDDEEQRPPEYYLAESAGLDVSRLRQQRYSPKTQGRLDWVKEHWDRYEYIQNAGTQTDLLTFSL
jgi:hypothetical protein